MKKMKKIAALMLSVMTCAASLSSMTSNAVMCRVDASDWEEFSSNWTPIEVNVGDTLYINKEIKKEAIYEDSSHLLLMSNNRVDPVIYIDIPIDVAYSDIKQVIEEVNPNYAMYHNVHDLISIKKVIVNACCDPEAGEAKDVTLDDAKKIYKALQEKGWVDNGWIKDFKFNAAHYTYSPGYFEYGYITAYDIENKEVLEKYINENELNCHLEEGVSGEDSIVKVVPDYEISSIEHFNLAEQIGKDTGVSQRRIINEGTETLSMGDVDLMNNTPGDANENGKLDMADAVYIMQCCSNPDEYRLTAQGRYNADFNNDGITNEDALTVQKILLEIE